jgi:hypothetical protein
MRVKPDNTAASDDRHFMEVLLNIPRTATDGVARQSATAAY